MAMFNNNGSYDMDSSQPKTDTIIGHSVKVDGILDSQGDISIDGEFKGTLKVASKLTIGKDAILDAEITAKEAFVAGTIKGNIDVSGKLELASSAKITGDVSAGIVVMEAGAVLNGKFSMGPKNTSVQSQPSQQSQSQHKNNN